MTVHFYQGDTLRAEDVLDEDGEPCEGALIKGEHVTVMQHSTENTDYVIVRRVSGKIIQLEKSRFALHNRKVVRTEKNYTTLEIALAKKLALYHKEERERQGVSYANWSDLNSEVKAIFLHTARQLIIVEGFVLG